MARQRARTIVRWAPKADDLLVSGLLDHGEEMAGRAVVVDAPLGRGHVVLFGTRPMWRWESQGAFALMLNAMANWNALDANERTAGRVGDRGRRPVRRRPAILRSLPAWRPDEHHDRILHDVKLRAPGRQFGGRAQEGIPRRPDRDEAQLGRTVRSVQGRRSGVSRSRRLGRHAQPGEIAGVCSAPTAELPHGGDATGADASSDASAPIASGRRSSVLVSSL